MIGSPSSASSGKSLAQHAGDQLLEAARHLDAGRSPADDDDCQLWRGSAGANLGGGVFDPRQQVGTQRHRIVQRLERQRVGVDALDAEAGRHRASGDDEVVVVERALVVDRHSALIEIDRRHSAEHELGVVAAGAGSREPES